MPKNIRRTGVVGKQSFQRDLERIRAALIASGGAAADPHTHDFDTRNVVTGETAGKPVGGTDNVIIGYEAGVDYNSTQSVIIGAYAGKYTSGTGTAFSVFIGSNAGRYIGTIGNICIGYNAGKSDAPGSFNTIVGTFAGSDITIGSATHNTLIGAYAGSNVEGWYNTFIGASAGYNNTANDCIAIGYFAGYAGSTDERLYIGSGEDPLIYGELDRNNLGINSRDMGGGWGVIAIKDAATIPGFDPTGGGILYVESGALKYRGSSGTVTTIANA